MKASAIRKLARDHDRAALEAAAEALAEHERDDLGIDGEDAGEKLTHVMLALRVVSRIEAGEALKDAFRAEMASVRGLLENESSDAQEA